MVKADDVADRRTTSPCGNRKSPTVPRGPLALGRRARDNPPMSCPFCDLGERAIVASNDLALAFRDAYPVGPGHTLIVPRRHVADWWSATASERAALLSLVDEVKAALDAELRPAGYNLGFNDRPAAGQTVMHLHLHLIPRFDGDVPDPTGGVRHVIPGKGKYGRMG